MEHHVIEEATPLDATLPRLPVGGELAATLPRMPVAVKDPEHMNDDTQRLIDQSIRGTQWIMIAIVIGVPLGFLTNVIIAHLGTIPLGTYSLMLLIVTAIQTFFLFGGANVVVNFIPRATAREKSAFLLSYIGLALVFSIIFFAAMLIFPRALQFLLQRTTPISSSVYLFLLLFIPVIICQTLTIAVLQGEMELPAAARTQYGVQVTSFLLALAVTFLVIPHHLLPAATGVAGIVLVAYTLSFLNGFVTLVRVVRGRWQLWLHWHLPPHFWRFTTSVHLLTISGFFFNSVDQLFILYYFTAGVREVGAFRPAIAVATYALWAPNLFTGAMYPLFTNLVAQKNFATLKGAYQRYTAISGVVVAFFGLVVGLFAMQILTIFGKGYDSSLPLLIIFAAMYVVVASSSYVATSALVTAHEDVWLNLIMYILALAVRFGLYFPLAKQFGLTGVALADAASLTLLHVGTLLIANWRYHVSVPLRQHVVSLTGAVMLAAFYLWQPTGTLVRLGEATAMLVVFVVIVSQLRLVSRADMARVSSRLGALKFLRRFLPA